MKGRVDTGITASEGVKFIKDRGAGGGGGAKRAWAAEKQGPGEDSEGPDIG